MSEGNHNYGGKVAYDSTRVLKDGNEEQHTLLQYTKQDEWPLDDPAGKSQSPIDIITADVISNKNIPFPVVSPSAIETIKPILHWDGTHLITYFVDEQGNSVPYDEISRFMLGGKMYDLVDLHYHVGSEHLFDGRRLDLEAHFVHKTKDGDIAVVGVLFEDKDDSLGKLNPFFEAAPPGKFCNGDPSQPIGVDCAGDFPPTNEVLTINHFLDLFFDSSKSPDLPVYKYDGSLTTPKCNEGVNWFVVGESAQLSYNEQLMEFEAMRKLFPNVGNIDGNYRAAQALNGRNVYKGKFVLTEPTADKNG